MLSLETYYRVSAGQMAGQLDLTDSNELIATRKLNFQTSAISSDNLARKEFCRCILENHDHSDEHVMAVSKALQNNTGKPLLAREVIWARAQLNDSSGYRKLKWLKTKKKTVVDEMQDSIEAVLHANVQKINTGTLRELANLSERNKPLYSLAVLEKKMNRNFLAADEKSGLRSEYYLLCNSFWGADGLLSNTSSLSQLNADEMDLLVRAVTGFLLLQDADSQTRESILIEKSVNTLQDVLAECENRDIELSETAHVQAGMVLDGCEDMSGNTDFSFSQGFGDSMLSSRTISREERSRAIFHSMGKWSPAYRLFSGEVRSKNLQSSENPNHILRLHNLDGIRHIKLVSYKGLKGKLRKFWDWLSRNGVRQNRAVYRELKKACEESKMFRKDSFDNEIWRPALEKAGVKIGGPLKLQEMEKIFIQVNQVAIGKGLANIDDSYGRWLPYRPHDGRRASKDILLSQLPSEQTDESSFELNELSTADLYKIRNQAIAHFVLLFDPYLTGNLSKNIPDSPSPEEILREMFSEKVAKACAGK